SGDVDSDNPRGMSADGTIFGPGARADATNFLWAGVWITRHRASSPWGLGRASGRDRRPHPPPPPKGMTMPIQTYLFFDGRAEEAIEFYRRGLGAEVQMLMRFK